MEDDISQLVKKAMAAFNKLSPEEQAAHRREQKISFVYGQLMLSGREVSKEEIARVHDEMVAGKIHEA